MSGKQQGSARTRISVQKLTSFAERLRGLLGRPPLGKGEGVCIEPCKQVHTFGMRFPLDVLHLDENGVILSIETLAPWRFGRYNHRAASVLEIRAGEASRLGLNPGNKPFLLEVDPGATEF